GPPPERRELCKPCLDREQKRCSGRALEPFERSRVLLGERPHGCPPQRRNVGGTAESAAHVACQRAHISTCCTISEKDRVIAVGCRHELERADLGKPRSELHGLA